MTAESNFLFPFVAIHYTSGPCHGTYASIEGSAPKDLGDVEVDIFLVQKLMRRDKLKMKTLMQFADTSSDTERCSGLNEAEVDSQFFGDSDLAPPYYAFDSIFQTRYKLLLSRVAYENKKSNPEGTSEIDDFSSTACDAQASSAPSLATSAGNEDTMSGAIYPATQNIPGYNTGNLGKPESAMSCFGGAIH
ncbi:hypothetical protein SADUNF_Sadunf19G0099200 [Salix dunnii]|uniref:Uncharacterized protein n=1 Tax=Salix dunnii TaxID=1413687 RepID=A0A835MCU8_9ROSI|nr:hypothetical protein SADUNF_Sadunf19G0099200 [Salix dunnii]